MDWIQEPFEVDARLHTSPDAPLARMRWVFTDQPFLPIDPPCLFLNRIWDNDDVDDLEVGMLAPFRNNYVQDARWVLPAVKFNGHMCKPEYLATGEPWPIPAGTPSTVYLDGWIPECCVMPCAADDCKQEPINGAPASQHLQYAIDAKDATDDTPAWRLTVADALTTGGGNWPGTLAEWLPNGRTSPAQFSATDLSRPDGTPYSHVEQYTFTPTDSVKVEQSADGWALTVVQAGVSTLLGLRLLAGVGQLYGSNLVIAPSVLPPDVVVTPPFTVPAIYYRAAPSTWAEVNIGPGLSFAAGTLEATGAGGSVTSVDISTTSFGLSVGGGPIVGAGVLTVDLAPDLDNLVGFTALDAILAGNGAGGWVAVAIGSGLTFVGGTLAASGGGTVTSVGLIAPAAGITVTGSPVTGASSFTLALANDLAALEALSGTNTIYYRSAASTWTAVTFNSSMSFSAGVLEPNVAIKDLVTLATGTGLASFRADGHTHICTAGDYLSLVAGTPDRLNVVPPTASNGEGNIATFVITGATGVYQNTGAQFILPNAGVYLVVGMIRGEVQPAAVGNHFVKVRLNNVTTGVAVANTETMIVLGSQNGVLEDGTAGFCRIFTVTGSTTFEWQATRTLGPWTVSQILSDTNGRSYFNIVRLSN